jgi:hypothetical protein
VFLSLEHFSDVAQNNNSFQILNNRVPFLLRTGIRLLSVTLVLGLLSLTMPAPVVSSSEVPSIDAEPRIIGIPSPGGGLIGLIPGQDKLLFGGSFPRDQLLAPNYALETGFFACSTAGLAAIGIPAGCSSSNGGVQSISLYEQSYSLKELSRSSKKFWRFGVKSGSDYGGTWRLSSTLGPTTVLGNVAPLNLIEPHFNDKYPTDYAPQTLRVNDILPYGFFQPGRAISSESFGQLFAIFFCKEPGRASLAPDIDDCRLFRRLNPGEDLTASMERSVIPPRAEGSYLRIKRVATNSTGSLTTWSATSELILGDGDAAPQSSIPLPFPKLWPSVREEFIRAGEPTYGSVGLWREYGSNAVPTSLSANWYRCKHAHDAGFQLPVDCKLLKSVNVNLDGGLSQHYYTPSDVDVGFRLMLNVAAANTAGKTNTYSATSVVVKEQRKEPPAFSGDRDGGGLGIRRTDDLTQAAVLDLPNFGIIGYPYPSLEVLFRICKSPPTTLRGRDDCQNAASVHLPPLQLDKPVAVTLSPKLKGGYLSAIMTLTNPEGTAELTLDHPERVSLLRMPEWVGVGPVISGWTSPGSTLRLSGPGITGNFNSAGATVGWLICTAGGGKQLAEIPRGCLQLPANRDSLVVRNNWEGKYVRSFAKATNEYGTSYVVTPAVGPVSAAPDASIPTLAGTAKVGMTLAAKVQSSENGIVTLFAWYRCVSEGLSLTMMQPTDCTNILNESGATYTIRQKDIGFRIRVRAYLYNQSGYSIAFSRTTEKVQ